MCVRETFDYYHIINQYRQRVAKSSEQLDKWVDEMESVRNKAHLDPMYLITDIEIGVRRLQKQHKLFDDPYVRDMYGFLRDQLDDHYEIELENVENQIETKYDIYWGIYVIRFPRSPLISNAMEWVHSIFKAFNVIWNILDAYTSIAYFERIEHLKPIDINDPIIDIPPEVYEAVNFLRNLKIYEEHKLKQE